MNVKCDTCQNEFDADIKTLVLDNEDERLYITCTKCGKNYPMGWISDNTRFYDNLINEASDRLRNGTMTNKAHVITFNDLKAKMKKEFKRLNEKYKEDERVAKLQL